jgi:hypothetical protein
VVATTGARASRTVAAGAATLALGALGAGCGSADQVPKVRAALARFATATARKDYRTLCQQVLAPSIVDQLNQLGVGCERALAQGLGNVQAPALTVRSVRVHGDRAEAQVHSSAANQPPSDDTLELIRVQGSWRISSLGARGPQAK